MTRPSYAALHGITLDPQVVEEVARVLVVGMAWSKRDRSADDDVPRPTGPTADDILEASGINFLSNQQLWEAYFDAAMSRAQDVGDPTCAHKQTPRTLDVTDGQRGAA